MLFLPSPAAGMMSRLVNDPAATDAANQHMKSHGRDYWSDADYNCAVSEYNRILPEEARP